MIVVDASLAAKWVLWERDSAQARLFLREHGGSLAAPDLIFVEVGGAIIRRGNEDKRLRKEMLRALDRWTQVWSSAAIQSFPLTPERLVDAAKIAFSVGHPLKDCVYVALADELSAELATCDGKLIGKAEAAYSKIRLLTDYPASPDNSA